jgi:hypothetical protein
MKVVSAALTSALLVSGCSQIIDYHYSKSDFTTRSFDADIAQCKRQNTSADSGELRTQERDCTMVQLTQVLHRALGKPNNFDRRRNREEVLQRWEQRQLGTPTRDRPSRGRVARSVPFLGGNQWQTRSEAVLETPLGREPIQSIALFGDSTF